MISRFLIFACSILLSVTSLSAQRPSRDMLQLETLYVDATRDRLLGNDDEAIAKFKKILESDEENDVVYYELAKVYLSKDAPKDALDVIKKATRLDPQNVWYQEELAAAHAANDDFTAAADVYEKLTTMRPKEEKFYYDLAFYLIKNNDIKEAIGVFDRHEKNFGVSEEVVGRKFNLYKTLDNQSKAEQELMKLVNAFPGQSNYAIGLAKFYEDTNNIGKAKSTYQKILKDNAENIEAQVALNKLNGGAKSGNGNNTSWGDPDIHIDVKISKIISAINGLPNASKDKQDEIISIAQQITQAHSDDAKAYAVYGDVLNFSGRTKEAITAYEDALKIEKNIYSVWDQLLQLYLSSEDMTALYTKSETALDYFPNEPTLYYLNGLAANALGSYSDAINALMQADIMTKSNPKMNAQVKSEMEIAKAGLGK